MAALHFPHSHPHPRCPAHHLRYLVPQGHWNEPDPAGQRTGAVMVAIGFILLAGFFLAAMQNILGSTSALLLACGSPFLLFGSILLLFAWGGWTIRRLRRVKQHCGRCRFYQPLEGQYSFGHCRADPHHGAVHRAHGCPFFRYSERAMVRERFARRPEALIKVTRKTS